MSKNSKKKNAIRFGAIAIAILIFGGVFSVWALSSQATASGDIGDIRVDGIEADDATGDTELLSGSIAGRPGNVADGYDIFSISEETDGDINSADFTAIVYLTNGGDLIDAGLRYMNINLVLEDSTGETHEQTLTLENGRVAFSLEGEDFDDSGAVSLTISTDAETGGTYGTHPFANDLDQETVDFMIDVEPGNVE